MGGGGGSGGNGTVGGVNSGGNTGGIAVEAPSKTYTGDDGTNTYKLVITSSSAKSVFRSVAAYDPQAGDAYVMTITNKITGEVTVSMGTVESITVDLITLIASEGDTFTVTINITIIVKIDVPGGGEIPVVDLVFYNIPDFAAFLDSMPENTADTHGNQFLIKSMMNPQ
jgi:hypothetical protein